MTPTGDIDGGRRQEMTRLGSEGRAAHAAALAVETEAGLPERLSWPAAAALIALVSLALWGLIGVAAVWLLG